MLYRIVFYADSKLIESVPWNGELNDAERYAHDRRLIHKAEFVQILDGNDKVVWSESTEF